MPLEMAAIICASVSPAYANNRPSLLNNLQEKVGENSASAMIAHKYSQSCRNTSSVGLIQYLCQWLGLQHCIFREQNALDQFQNETFKIESTTRKFVQAIWQFSRLKPSSSVNLCICITNFVNKQIHFLFCLFTLCLLYPLLFLPSIVTKFFVTWPGTYGLNPYYGFRTTEQPPWLRVPG